MRDPTVKMMSVEDVMEKFNPPDLCGTLADFLTQMVNNDCFYISSNRIASLDSLLPFDNLQVWTKTSWNPP